MMIQVVRATEKPQVDHHWSHRKTGIMHQQSFTSGPSLSLRPNPSSCNKRGIIVINSDWVYNQSCTLSHSRDMRFQSMWYVQPAKAQTSLRIRAV